MDTADFESPDPASRLDFGAVEVDKKLVGVSHRWRDWSRESDVSRHALQLCKFSASVRHRIYGTTLTTRARGPVRKSRTCGKFSMPLDAKRLVGVEQYAETSRLISLMRDFCNGPVWE